MADDWRIEELKELRKKRQFYCPVCNEIVQLKLGRARLWHFSHQSNAICLDSLEKESVYHLKGKKRLYDWLKLQRIEAALECYLPIIRQRPDVLFRLEHTLYALEYQCSPIDTLLLEKRSRGYNQLGIVPIWILGGNRLKRHGPHTFSLKSYEWLSSRPIKNHFYHLTYYCSEQNRFAFLSQLTPYSSTKFLASYQETPLLETTIQSIVHPSLQKQRNLFEKWLIVKKNWRYQNITPYPTKIERMIREILYQHRIPASLFPIEAGWPTSYHYLISTYSYYWQIFLLLECLQHQPLHQLFSRQMVIYCIQPYIDRKWITLRRVNGDNHWSLAIDGFLNFLTQIGYLEKVPAQQEKYRRVRDVVIPINLDEAIEHDQSLKTKFMNQNNQGNNKGISVQKTNI
jgi:competence CoiA-like predicted nuclease